MIRLCLILIVLGALTGCATGPDWQELVPEGPRLPYRISYEFTSEVEEPYIVRSGPIETLDSFPVNSWFEQALGAWAEQRQTASAGQVLQVKLHLANLQTGYDSIGTSPDPGDGAQPVLLASAGGFPFFFGRNSEIDGNGIDIPEEVTKSVRLEAESTVAVGGEQIVRRMTVRNVRKVHRDYYDSWFYDYHGVMKGAVLKTLERLDLLVREWAGSGKGAPWRGRAKLTP